MIGRRSRVSARSDKYGFCQPGAEGGTGPAHRPTPGQIELDAKGGVVVGPDLATSREGVFAAGDVVADSYPRVATAMGQGVLAARSVLRYLSRQAR